MAYNSITQPFGTVVKYTDFDLSFLANPSTADLRTLNNLASIKQAMKILLFTNYGERPFQPNLSCNMQKAMFSQLDPVTAMQLQNEITATLSAFEPRILLQNVTCQQASDPNQLNVTITFKLQNSANVETVSVFLGRKR